MIAQCEDCGAPLDITATSSSARCNYCDKVNRVRRMQTVLPQTPAGWQPPAAWSPPPQYQIPQPTLAYHQPSNGGRVVVLVVAIAMTLAIAGIAGFLVLLGSSSSRTVTTTSSPDSPPFVATGVPGPGGGFTLTTGDQMVCMGGEKRISGQKLGTVVANNGCILTLTSCTVTGNPGVLATGNSRVILEGGEIKPGGGVAVVVSGNALVELRGGAKLSGQVVEQENGKLSR